MLRTEGSCCHLKVKSNIAASAVKTLTSCNLKTETLSRDLCPTLNRTGPTCP